MRSSRGEGGARIVREKLEAEGGNGNCERLCSLIINTALSLIPVLFKILSVLLTPSSCLTSLSYIFKSSPSSVCQTFLFKPGSEKYGFRSS
jgi:hypothetical protein